MAQDNPFAKYVPAAAPMGGPLPSPPERPKDPPAPKTTYRVLSPEEAAAKGLPAGQTYEVSSEGNVDTIPNPKDGGAGGALDPKTVEGQKNIAAGVLKNSGVDFEKGVDPVAGLIKGSTSGLLQYAGAETYGAVTGDATDGMEKIARLATIGNDMVLQMSGGSLGAQISNSDRDFIAARMGDIANPKKTADERLAAWDQVKQRLASISGVEYKPMATTPGSRIAKSRFGKYEVEYSVPADATDEQIKAASAAALREKYPDVDFPAGVNITHDPGPGGGPSGGGNWYDPLVAGGGDILQGAGDLAGIVGNPLNATINAAFGTNLSTDLGKTARGDIPQGDPTISAINRGGVAALTGAGAARGAAALVNPGVARNALAQFSATPVRDVAGGAGAGAGAEFANRNELGPLGQTGAAVAGGLAGYGGANAMANAFAPRGASAVSGAMQRQGVDLLPADTGGTATKILTTGAKASPLSAGPIRTAARESVDQLQAATQRVGGPAPTTDKAGAAVKDAAQRYTKETRARGEQLYTSAYREAGGVRAIKPLRTVAAIDNQIARLQENPTDEAAGMVKELTTLRERIADGVSIQGLRDARTSLSAGVYDGKLRSGPVQGMYKKILGNVAEDIDAGLRSAGKGKAAEIFKRADRFWADRVEHIDEVLQPLIGTNKGGEEVVKTLESMTRGSSGGDARLSRLLAHMTPDEAQGVRATVINQLGKATAGQQDAAGEVFSPGTFLTNWNKMTPQAKASLFSNKAQRANLDDIALLAENMKATEGMSNFSNTAMTLGGGGQSVGLVALGAATHPVAAVLAGGGQFATGKLLASPGFARILAKTAKMPSAAAKKSMIDELAVLGTREPLLRQDAQILQQYLTGSFSASPGRAAAQDETYARREPVQ